MNAPKDAAIELKPCPFCGSADIDAHFALVGLGNDPDSAHHEPGCMTCGATAESVTKWNTRALESEKARGRLTDEPSEIESCIACLGDDAARIRADDLDGAFSEVADNMEVAIRLLASRRSESSPAASAPPRSNEGWVAVPIEPTQEMIDAGQKNESIHGETTCREVYKAMIAAYAGEHDGT